MTGKLPPEEEAELLTMSNSEWRRHMAREKRPPDYKLTIKEKDGPSRQQVGVGWLNEHGGINITLDPAVVLDRNLLKDFYLSVWPLGDEEYQRVYRRMNGGKDPPEGTRPPTGGNDEGDIPF